MARWTTVAVLVVAALVAPSCGSDDGGAEVVTIDALAPAFADTAEVTSFRYTVIQAQTIDMGALGLDDRNELDPDRPTVVGEVSPTRSHVRMELEAVVPGPGPDVGFDMWLGDGAVVFDTTEYAELLEANPGAELGPFVPGVASVDLAALEGLGPEVVQAVTGSGAIDLRRLAERLPSALTDVELIADDPPAFRGRITFAELTDVLGGDVETLSRSIAASIAPMLTTELGRPVDVEDLVAAYVEAFESLAADVEIHLTTDGLLGSLRTTTDLAAGLSGVVDPLAEALDAPASALDELRDAFADGEWIQEQLITYEAAPDLVVPTAPEATEDRTEEWIEFLTTAGIIGG